MHFTQPGGKKGQGHNFGHLPMALALAARVKMENKDHSRTLCLGYHTPHCSGNGPGFWALSP